MDKTIRVWSNNQVDGFPSTVIKSHGACVKSVAFSSDSRFIVSGSDDKSVKIFNVELVNSRPPLASSSRVSWVTPTGSPLPASTPPAEWWLLEVLIELSTSGMWRPLKKSSILQIMLATLMQSDSFQRATVRSFNSRFGELFR